MTNSGDTMTVAFLPRFNHGGGAHSVDSLGAKLLGTNFLEQVTETGV